MVLCDVCNASLLMNLALNGLHDSFLSGGHAILWISLEC